MKQKKKSNKKRIFLFSAIALIIILIIIGVNKKDNNGISVTVQNPQINSIVEVIPANGKIQPVTEVKISPDVSGEIIELNFKEGDKVNKGDLIIKIKQDVYISLKDRAEASLNAAKAQYLQQKAQLRKIKLDYDRNKSLYEQKAISQSEYETSLSQYEVANEQLKASEYNVKSAEAGLKEAQENLVKTYIYAPMSGTISKLSVEKGERVVGTSQMAGTEMLRIANLNEMEVLVDVNENDIIRLNNNDTATIEVDAYPNRKFKGIVTEIANSSKNADASISVDQVTNFEVRVAILQDSYKDLLEVNSIPFRPGMSASVSIETNRKDSILTIPLQCITTRKGLVKDSLSTNPQLVFVYNNNTKKVSVQIVETGIQDISNIEITKGLTKDMQIVTSPYGAISNTLKNGDLVSVEGN
jgi:RND family efflux transporter, MFP subunit